MKARLRIFLAALIAVASAGIASAQGRKPQSAQNPVDAIVNFKLRADPVEPADFVKKSRPAEELQYIPIGAARPQPATRILSFEELKAKEAELDGVRARHDRIVRRPAAKVKLNPVAMAAKPVVKRAKPTCLITCTVDPVPRR